MIMSVFPFRKIITKGLFLFISISHGIDFKIKHPFKLIGTNLDHLAKIVKKTENKIIIGSNQNY
jgi:hypothetical protein